MKVIYKAPGCAPEPRDIPNTLEELQAAVGGYIETVTFLGVDFVGPILIVGRDDEDFADLTPEVMRMLLEGWK